MFSINDIRNIAVQMERNGAATYRLASQAARDLEVAEILSWMAEEEERHAAWFEKIVDDRVLSEEQREVEAMGKTLLQDMMAGNEFLLAQSELERMDAVPEVIARSRQFEDDTVVFYEFIENFLDDVTAKAQMALIIAEEKAHSRELARLLDRLPDPAV